MRQFSHSTHSHSLASQKLRYWFGNHTRDCVRGTDSRGVLDLSGKAHRRPLPLQPAQAYSILYYAEGTPLYREIRTLYDKYKEGDKETVDALAHLFNKSSTSKTSPTPTPENGATPSQTDATTPQTDTATPQTDTATAQTDTATAQTNTATAQTDTALPPPRGASTRKTRSKNPKKAKKTSPLTTHRVPQFVVFQQAIIREKIKEISEAEAAAVETLIEERYDAAMNVWESPWLAMAKGNEQDSEDELENTFYQTYVFSTNSTQSRNSHSAATLTGLGTRSRWLWRKYIAARRTRPFLCVGGLLLKLVLSTPSRRCTTAKSLLYLILV